MFTKFIFLLNEFKKLKHEIKWRIQYNGYWLIIFIFVKQIHQLFVCYENLQNWRV